MKRGLKRGKSQISMEYILMFSIVLMILVSGIYILRMYVFESNDKVIDRKLNEISNLLISKAKKIYYYGPPSRTSLNIEMPVQINNMYILFVDENENYLIFKVLTSSGEKKVMYESTVPLYAEYCQNMPDLDCQDYDCKCFPQRFYSQGLKNIVLEARNNCQYIVQGNTINTICVNVTTI